MLRIDNKRDPNGEVHIGQTFIGKYKPKADEKGQHADNFQRALENALQIADSTRVINERKRMRLKRTFDVKVTFEATVRIASPGNIGEYRAIVTEV